MGNIVYKLTMHGNSYAVQSRYCLKYEIGKITECIPGTLGIFCFKNMSDIYNFLKRNSLYKFEFVYRVKGLSKMAVPDYIPSAYFSILEEYYNNRNNLFEHFINKVPDGTICYQAVEVLSEA